MIFVSFRRLVQGGVVFASCIISSFAGAAPITVNYNETGTINSIPLTINGTAQGDPSLGQYSIQINYSSPVPKWDLLSIFLTHSSTDRLYSKEIDTGYGLGMNFITLTGGNLTVDRNVSYRNQTGNLIGTASFFGQLSSITSTDIDLTGNVIASGDWSAVGDVVSIGSYTERWTPDGPGRILSELTIPYTTESGETIYAETSSIFNFDPSVTLSQPQLATRNYTFSRLSDTAFNIEFSGTITKIVTPIPIPATATLISSGLGVFALFSYAKDRRRRRK